jgi:hypothetical protein
MNCSQPSPLLTCLRVYEVVVLIGEVYDVPFPDAYVEYLSAFKLFSVDLFRVLQLDCVFPFDFRVLLVVGSSVGLALSCIASICEVVVFRGWAKDRKEAILFSVTKVLFVVMYLFYPGLSSLFFRAFNCKAVDGQLYLVAGGC